MPDGVCSLVTDDRLWDFQGRQWIRDESYADGRTAEGHFGWIRPVGVVRRDGLLRWVTSHESWDFWESVRPHYLAAGESAPSNEHGETFSGHVWRSGNDRLFTLQVHA
ncbi:MAG: hypothetical protein ACT4QG_16235 [Sporichthyaceae bacterium]